MSNIEPRAHPAGSLVWADNRKKVKGITEGARIRRTQCRHPRDCGTQGFRVRCLGDRRAGELQPRTCKLLSTSPRRWKGQEARLGRRHAQAAHHPQRHPQGSTSMAKRLTNKTAALPHFVGARRQTSAVVLDSWCIRDLYMPVRVRGVVDLGGRLTECDDYPQSAANE